MSTFSFTEFKPTIFFLGKFVGIYLIANFLYGLYVDSYLPRVDPVTRWVTGQTAVALKATGHKAQVRDHSKKATTSLLYKNKTVVAVYEGCNGINISIIYVAFLVALGPYRKAMLYMIPFGILIIHFFNLMRVGGLFLITIYKPEWVYFMHKYLFTAFIYLIVFLLWLWWVRKFSITQTHAR